MIFNPDWNFSLKYWKNVARDYMKKVSTWAAITPVSATRDEIFGRADRAKKYHVIARKNFSPGWRENWHTSEDTNCQNNKGDQEISAWIHLRFQFQSGLKYLMLLGLFHTTRSVRDEIFPRNQPYVGCCVGSVERRVKSRSGKKTVETWDRKYGLFEWRPFVGVKRQVFWWAPQRLSQGWNFQLSWLGRDFHLLIARPFLGDFFVSLSLHFNHVRIPADAIRAKKIAK